MRAAGLLCLVMLATASGALGDACRCECACGTPGAPCCSCANSPLDDRCVFNSGALWCSQDGVQCGGDGACFVPDVVVDASLSGCGGPGGRCCDMGFCAGRLLCSSGGCVDPDAVLDASPCGLEGGECCGFYNDCDEDLVCAGGRCAGV